MAYIYSRVNISPSKTIPILCGEEKDTCYICGKSLNGKDCLRLDPDGYLICYEKRCEFEAQLEKEVII